MKMVIPQQKRHVTTTTRDISQIMPREQSSHDESEEDAKEETPQEK